MAFTSFAEIEDYIRSHHLIKRVALACAHDEDALKAVVHARNKGIIEPILIGKEPEIRALLSGWGEDAAAWRVIPLDDDREAVDLAVRMCREGEADLPMKGLMHTATFMKGILSKETGLIRPGQLLSQATVLEVPEMQKLMVISDCAVNIAPDVEQKIQIIHNAVALARSLGVEEPKIALLSALEVVNPKIPSTVDAAEIVERLKDRYCIGGPFALDNAVSEAAARHKGIDHPAAGHADILIVPDLWSGNIFTKGLTFFGHMASAGLLNGLTRAVIMTSRTDTPENKYYSILCCVVQSEYLAKQ